MIFQEFPKIRQKNLFGVDVHGNDDFGTLSVVYSSVKRTVVGIPFINEALIMDVQFGFT